jgi:hypothetical protein
LDSALRASADICIGQTVQHDILTVSTGILQPVYILYMEVVQGGSDGSLSHSSASKVNETRTAATQNQ